MSKTRPTNELVDEFDDAAQYWGWQRDQGSRESARQAEQMYEESKARLLKRIRYLEKKADFKSRKGN